MVTTLQNEFICDLDDLFFYPVTAADANDPVRKFNTDAHDDDNNDNAQMLPTSWLWPYLGCFSKQTS